MARLQSYPEAVWPVVLELEDQHALLRCTIERVDIDGGSGMVVTLTGVPRKRTGGGR